MDDANAYRKAVKEVTADLLAHPQEGQAHDKFVADIMAAWSSESKNGGALVGTTPIMHGAVLKFSDKSSEKVQADYAAGVFTVKDTLANSDQAITQYEQKSGDAITTTYIAPREQDGRTVTDSINIAWAGKSAHIVSVEENDGGNVRKVSVRPEK